MDEQAQQEATNGEVQKQETEKEVKTRGKKTEKEFVDDLTTSESLKVEPNGTFTSVGAFPQVVRKPVKDKTSNGLERTTY